MVLALVAALTVAQTPLREDEPLAFARTLLDEQDPYRAITELKRFAFLRGGREALHTHLFIGHLYAKGKQVEASRFHLMRVMAAKDPLTSLAARLLVLENVCITRILSGNCAEEIAALPDDTPLGLKPYLTHYFAALMGSERPSSTGALTAAHATLDLLTEEHRAMPLRRPWLSGLLSAVVPGAGQLANGRPLDAALAFVLTGGCVAGTVALLARPEPQWGFGVPLGVLALIFYAGNIVNAVGDAYRLNEQAALAWAKQLERRAWPKFTFALGPNGATFGLTMALDGQERVVLEAE